MRNKEILFQRFIQKRIKEQKSIFYIDMIIKISIIKNKKGGFTMKIKKVKKVVDKKSMRSAGGH
ncbi:hypothetical protein [Streptococcus caballi]|uniref:hypothetical protein n=1 Tax=Streptococcus caballi TaxID=439220 RepID=UPI0012EAF450|nr:hypothetical protein [Streptococcus caballi]